MRNPFVRAIQTPPAAKNQLYMYPVTITQLSPLLITLNGATGVRAQKQSPSATYALGAAICLKTANGNPIVPPNG